MNGYAEESKAIQQQLIQELNRIEQEYPPAAGLDGQSVEANKSAIAEYNRKLLALKQKYNKDN